MQLIGDASCSMCILRDKPCNMSILLLTITSENPTRRLSCPYATQISASIWLFAKDKVHRDNTTLVEKLELYVQKQI
jgi:hypothetical protein